MANDEHITWLLEGVESWNDRLVHCCSAPWPNIPPPLTFSRGCLRRRVPDETVLRRRVHALQEERNTDRASIDWRFSIQDARTKLHRLYPSNN